MTNLKQVDEIPDEVDPRLITDDKADWIAGVCNKGIAFKPSVVEALLYTRKVLVDALEGVMVWDEVKDVTEAKALLKALKGDLT